jgi:hypothetical protein
MAKWIVLSSGGRVKDLTGLKFVRLLVLELFDLKSRPCGARSARWLCVCACGNLHLAIGSELGKGVSSCGCFRREFSQSRIKHGCWSPSRSTPKLRALYFTWRGMKARCLNPKATGFHNYGGRGIIFDPRWNDFTVFLGEMGRRHRIGLTLDRKDVNGPYCKKNCRWANDSQQHNNCRNNRRITFAGACLTIAQWAKKMKIGYRTIHYRLSRGWTVVRALTQSVR